MGSATTDRIARTCHAAVGAALAMINNRPAIRTPKASMRGTMAGPIAAATPRTRSNDSRRRSASMPPSKPTPMKIGSR